MSDVWQLCTPEEVEVYQAKALIEPPRRQPTVQCLCGRFARFIRVRHYYNGTWDCIATDVECSRCGSVSIEHV